HGGGSYWENGIDDARSVAFSLADDTGSTALRLKSAEPDLHPDVEERPGFLNSARPHLGGKLQQGYGHSTVGLSVNRTLCSCQPRIEEGDALVVLGTAREGPDGGWELVRGAGVLLVSDRGLAELLSSYRWTAFLWWCLAALLPVAAGVGLIALAGFR